MRDAKEPLKEIFPLCITRSMKQDILTLKNAGVKHQEWLRELIASALPEALKQINTR